MAPPFVSNCGSAGPFGYSSWLLLPRDRQCGFCRQRIVREGALDERYLMLSLSRVLIDQDPIPLAIFIELEIK